MDNLKLVFQQHNLHLARFKETLNNNFLQFFSNNANFVAWTNLTLPLKSLLTLSEKLTSKTILLTFFYQGQIFTMSRLKKIENFFLEPFVETNSPRIVFWLSFRTFFG